MPKPCPKGMSIGILQYIESAPPPPPPPGGIDIGGELVGHGNSFFFFWKRWVFFTIVRWTSTYLSYLNIVCVCSSTIWGHEFGTLRNGKVRGGGQINSYTN